MSKATLIGKLHLEWIVGGDSTRHKGSCGHRNWDASKLSAGGEEELLNTEGKNVVTVLW